MKSWLVTTFVLILALFGGTEFYGNNTVLYAWLIGGWATIAWGIWLLLKHKVPLFTILKWPLLAVLLSTVVNYQIIDYSLSRLWLYALAVAVLAISSVHLDDKQIFDGIYWAGWLWPGIMLAAFYLGWWDHRNIVSFWAMIFIAVGLSKRAWIYIAPHVLVLFFLDSGSRSGILGTIVAVGVVMWPYLRLRLRTVGLCIPLVAAGLAALIAWRPESAWIRMYYWESAISAFGTNPVFGVGPGGLKALQFIPEMNLHQIHAHNALVSWLAETGLVGLTGLVTAGGKLLALRPRMPRYVLAILAGILAYSMVDEPLFWPGPLLFLALVASTIHWSRDHGR